MKKPDRETRERTCKRKRRYRSQGDALDAARVAGVERQRQAYQCPLCGHWHLSSR
jgi:ribosomal protein L32